MFGHLLALETAQLAVAEAKRLGASFADARFEIHQREDLTTRNGRLRRCTANMERGLGVRVLVNGAWGFCASAQPTRHEAAVLAKRAVELARAAAVLQSQPVQLVHEPAHCAVYRTPIERDPLGVAIEEKINLLMEIDRRLRAKPMICLAVARLLAHRIRKLYVSSDGAEIEQDLFHTGVGYEAGASDGNEVQICSYPDGAGGVFAARGWELIESLPLLDKTEEVASEAVEMLKADPCPNERTSLILGTRQLALQIHESCGHPCELDRALGFERNFAGTSFLTPDRLGSYEYGSKHVTLYADANKAQAIGTFGFDDEGVEAQRVDLVTQGRFSGYLSSRDMAKRVGLKRSSGTARAASWASLPLIRMTNVCLEPGPFGRLDDLIADTKSGVYMDVNRSWSIDDRRLNFQFGCETAWQIKDGKKVRRLKNPVYAGVTPQFWKSCDAICGPEEFQMHGLSDCGKGQPLQLMSVGHGASPARFVGVEVGATAAELPSYGGSAEIPLSGGSDRGRREGRGRARGRQRRRGAR